MTNRKRECVALGGLDFKSNLKLGMAFYYLSLVGLPSPKYLGLACGKIYMRKNRRWK